VLDKFVILAPLITKVGYGLLLGCWLVVFLDFCSGNKLKTPFMD